MEVVILVLVSSESKKILILFKDCSGVNNGGMKYDTCGVCGGNNSTCLVGCDGAPYSNKTYDKCGVCGGTNTCIGCDGLINSHKAYDLCGICGGNSESCIGCDGLLYSYAGYDSCGVCNGKNSTCTVLAVDCLNTGKSLLKFVLTLVEKGRLKQLSTMHYLLSFTTHLYPVYKQSNFNCGEIFSMFVTSMLGTGSFCNWKNTHELNIYLGTDSNFNLPLTLSFNTSLPNIIIDIMSEPLDICILDSGSINYYTLLSLSTTFVEIHSVNIHHQLFKIYNSNGSLVKESSSEVLVLEFYDIPNGVYFVHQCNSIYCTTILEVNQVKYYN